MEGLFTGKGHKRMASDDNFPQSQPSNFHRSSSMGNLENDGNVMRVSQTYDGLGPEISTMKGLKRTKTSHSCPNFEVPHCIPFECIASKTFLTRLWFSNQALPEACLVSRIKLNPLSFQS
jgi:hypothetical protein